MGAGSELIRAQIVAAAVDRHKAQQRLEEGARHGDPTHFMRQRQRDVNQADRRIRAATAEFVKTFPAETQMQDIVAREMAKP